MPIVLVIEDNKDLNELIVEEIVASGISARGYTSASSFISGGGRACVYLVDLNLPDIDGIDLVRLIRRDVPLARIIILTARPDFESRLAGIEAGASAYLEKPCSAREIIAALTAQLSYAAFRESGLGLSTEAAACVRLACLGSAFLLAPRLGLVQLSCHELHAPSGRIDAHDNRLRFLVAYLGENFVVQGGWDQASLHIQP